MTSIFLYGMCAAWLSAQQSMGTARGVFATVPMSAFLRAWGTPESNYVLHSLLIILTCYVARLPRWGIMPRIVAGDSRLHLNMVCWLVGNFASSWWVIYVPMAFCCRYWTVVAVQWPVAVFSDSVTEVHEPECMRFFVVCCKILCIHLPLV